MTEGSGGWRRRAAHVAAFCIGALFAVGLAVSGMTKPSKVVGFLDLCGAWDPSLACVMFGAVTVHFFAYRIVALQGSPLFSVTFSLPTRRDVDARLVLGAALFGIGWGLSGLCPGPALVALGGGSATALVFAAAMTLGMLGSIGLASPLNPTKPPPALSD